MTNGNMSDEELMSSYKDKLIQDLYDLHVCADITIEELADYILDDIKHLNGRNICIDCANGCPIDK